MNRDSLDEIRIRGLEVFANHGVFSREREEGQLFYLDLTLFADLQPAGVSDDLKLTADYGSVALKAAEYFRGKTFELIESAAEDTVRKLLLEYSMLREIELEVHKPHAPIPSKFSDVSVKIFRRWYTAYVALGSNLGDREQHLNTALDGMRALPGLRVKEVSSFRNTRPYGGVEQGDFLNAVCRVETVFTPEELLSVLQKLEKKAKRVREVRWGPRTLDLDILYYEDRVISSAQLTLPHPDIQNRDFVLEPLAEIAPYLRHPQSGETTLRLLERLNECGTDRCCR